MGRKEENKVEGRRGRRMEEITKGRGEKERRVRREKNGGRKGGKESTG